MTEWAKFVSGVMFLDYTSGQHAVPFVAPVAAPARCRPRAALQVHALLYRCRAHQTRETRLT